MKIAPWAAHRIVADDGRLLVVDKPSRAAVHGGDPALEDDVVHRLAALLSARGEDDYLSVHQRLDRDASGVLAFVRDRDLNAEIAADVEQHRAERQYVAVVEGRLDGEGVLHDQIASAAGRSRVVRQGGREAVSRYRVVERRGRRALVELSLETGRTHQLRVQLAHRGAPICGDDLYDGTPAPRLMLHARRVAFPSLDRAFDAPIPDALDEHLRGESALPKDVETLGRHVDDALVARWGVARGATAFRAVDGAADAMPGVTVDVYDDWAVLSAYDVDAFERRREIAEILVEAGLRGVYVKSRPRADLRKVARDELAPAAPIAGRAAPPALAVAEGDLRVAVDLADGLSTGLFLDQRDNRTRVRELSAGARVLNLFCYTGTFTVAAALGGATRTVSVDLSKKALERTANNLDLADVSGDRHSLVTADVTSWLGRARRKKREFDVVVLDPPSFATRGRGTFRFDRDYAGVAEGAIALLSSGGRLLAVTNYRKVSRRRFRRLLRDAAEASGRTVRQLKDLPMPADHPDRPGGFEPTKAVLLTVE